MLYLHTFKLNSSVFKVHLFIYFYFWSISFSFTFTSALVSSPLSSATVHHHSRFSERPLASMKKETVSTWGDSNFILQSYCAFFFHFSLSFCWVFLAYSDLHHLALKKLPKLPHKKKKKKKERKHFVFRPSIHLPTETTRFRWYGRYFFRYEIRGLSVPDYWPVWYIPVVPAGTVQNWLPCSQVQQGHERWLPNRFWGMTWKSSLPNSGRRARWGALGLGPLAWDLVL